MGNDILGFDAAGNVVNESDSHGGIQDWTLICQKAAKVINDVTCDLYALMFRYSSPASCHPSIKPQA